MYPISALNPDCSFIWFEIVHCISCIASEWYHHVWCILYTNNVTNGTMLCIAPVSVRVACSPIYQWAVKGMGSGPVSLTLAKAFSGEAVSIGTLVDKLIPSTLFRVDVYFELCYWLARSVSRASSRCTSLLCWWVLWHESSSSMKATLGIGSGTSASRLC